MECFVKIGMNKLCLADIRLEKSHCMKQVMMSIILYLNQAITLSYESFQSLQFMEYLGIQEEEGLWAHWMQSILPAIRAFQCGLLYSDQLKVDLSPLDEYIKVVDHVITSKSDEVCLS